MSKSILVGDIVMLRSGGPRMTVVAIALATQDREELVYASWFSSDHQQHQFALPTPCVRVVERANAEPAVN